MITMLTARRLERAARGEGPPPSWRCNVLLSSMGPRAGPYRAVPKPETPPLSGFPVVAAVGTKDEFYEYAKEGIHNIHDRMEWFEHAGGHAAPREPEVNVALVEAIRRAVG